MNDDFLRFLSELAREQAVARLTAEIELPDFLIARIAEDKVTALEVAAKAARLDEALGAAPPDEHPWELEICENGTVLRVGASTARVLADSYSKEQLVREVTAEWRDGYVTARLVLEFLALPYAGHPDYNPAWRPQRF